MVKTLIRKNLSYREKESVLYKTSSLILVPDCWGEEHKSTWLNLSRQKLTSRTLHKRPQVCHFCPPCHTKCHSNSQCHPLTGGKTVHDIINTNRKCSWINTLCCSWNNTPGTTAVSLNLSPNQRPGKEQQRMLMQEYVFNPYYHKNQDESSHNFIIHSLGSVVHLKSIIIHKNQD